MATNIYLKIEGPEVKGESSNDKHKGEVEILSWSHGFSQTTSPTRSTAGGGTVEKANHMDLVLTKYVDVSTPDLMKYCWSGKHFDKMTIAQFRSAGDADVEYLTVELEHVIISSYSISAGPGDLPVESLSLAYAKVTYTYDPTDALTGASAGKKPISHDLATGAIA